MGGERKFISSKTFLQLVMATETATEISPVITYLVGKSRGQRAKGDLGFSFGARVNHPMSDGGAHKSDTLVDQPDRDPYLHR